MGLQGGGMQRAVCRTKTLKQIRKAWADCLEARPYS
jgi:hypothetical protein